MTKKGKIKGKKSSTKSKKAKKLSYNTKKQFEDLKDEITVTEGVLQNLVYSEDGAGEENVCVSVSPQDYIPDNNNGKKLLLAENSRGTSLRLAASDVEPPILQQTSSFSLLFRRGLSCSGTLWWTVNSTGTDICAAKFIP